MTFIFHNIWIYGIILPIDLTNIFSRWLLHHPPEQYFDMGQSVERIPQSGN